VQQTKLASSLVNFRAHYKIVGLYFYGHTAYTTRSISIQFMLRQRLWNLLRATTQQ